MAENFTPEPVPVDVPLVDTPKKDNKKTWIIVAIVVVVLCCCCAAVGGLIYWLVSSGTVSNMGY